MSKSNEASKKRREEKKRLSFQDLATINKEKEEKELKREDKRVDEINEEPAETKGLSDLFVSKPTMEETHTRRTFLIRNDLLKQLDKSSDKPKNFTKTKFINYLLEKGLEEFKK